MNNAPRFPTHFPLLLLLLSSASPVVGRAGESPAPGASPVLVVDIRKFNSDERLSAVCFQGLANRSGARVYLNTGPSVRWMQFDFDDRKNAVWSKKAAEELKTRYASICDAWIDILSGRGLYRFETVSMIDLLQSQRQSLRGVILYEKLDDDLAVAATMAGLRAAVPMTPHVYEAWGKPLGLPVVFDIRSLSGQYDPKQERRLAAHRWALEHLFPECGKNGALSRDRTYGLDAHDTLIDVDLAVANRWITYDLKYAPDGTPIVHSDHYYTLGEPETFARELIRDAAKIPSPWFVAVYGAKMAGTPHNFYEVARRLPADKFKVVALEELFTAARAARPRVEGRQFKRSGEKPLPPGAGQAPAP